MELFCFFIYFEQVCCLYACVYIWLVWDPVFSSDGSIEVFSQCQWTQVSVGIVVIHHVNTLCLSFLRESLFNILVVVKSLGMGFHLPVDGIRSLSLVRLVADDGDDGVSVAHLRWTACFRGRSRNSTDRIVTLSTELSIMGMRWLTLSASPWVGTKSSCRDSVPATFMR